MILDEPTVGLDPQTRRSVWEYVLRLRATTGLTIFMTTHYMEEAEYCDRIGIIDNGRIIALDTPAGLKRMVGQDVVRVTTSDAERAAQEATRWLGKPVQREGDAVDGENAGNVVRVEGENGQVLAAGLIRHLTLSDIEVRSVTVQSPSLDDVFLQLTGKAIREESASGKDRMADSLRKRGRIRR